MPARRSLRNRVAVTLAVFGGVVSLVLAMIIHLASQDLERRLIDETLKAELDDYVARRARNPQSLPERTATIRAFVVSPGATHSEVPKSVENLPVGTHPMVLEGIPYRAAVREVGSQRFVVLYDISALKRREQGFLLLLARKRVVDHCGFRPRWPVAGGTHHRPDHRTDPAGGRASSRGRSAAAFGGCLSLARGAATGCRFRYLSAAAA
ncbi:MAG: hypothetical protein ABW068_17355 [Candidatus Thiodiazotropha sp.]